MYPNSTQKKNWTFQNEQELIQMRMRANQEFIQIHGSQMDVNISRIPVCLHYRDLRFSTDQADSGIFLKSI